MAEHSSMFENESELRDISDNIARVREERRKEISGVAPAPASEPTCSCGRPLSDCALCGFD